MPYRELILDDVPELSTESALQLIDVLYALAGALENRYFDQIREMDPPEQYDLFKANPSSIPFDDSLPEF